MVLRGPTPKDVAAFAAGGDVASLVRAFSTTKRRDVRAAAVKALRQLGAQTALVDMLGDANLRRPAAAALVELGTEALQKVAPLLRHADLALQEGALYTVYYYARYRDMAAARDLLRETATSAISADLAAAASSMLNKVDRVRKERDQHIDFLLEKIALRLQDEAAQPDNILIKMYSGIRRDRVTAMTELVAMRFGCLQRVIDRAGDFGDTAVAALLGLALNELGGEVVPPIRAALKTGDKRQRSALTRALLCLRRAQIPGAAQALDESGIRITETLDRQAARVYKQWVKE